MVSIVLVMEDGRGYESGTLSFNRDKEDAKTEGRTDAIAYQGTSEGDSQ